MADFHTLDLGLSNIHLGSGEDIIGMTTLTTDGNFVITRPMLPNIIPVDQERFKVGLLPLRPYLGATKEVEIQGRHVAYVVPVEGQMAEVYQKFTGAIQIAQPGDMPPVPPNGLVTL